MVDVRVSLLTLGSNLKYGATQNGGNGVEKHLRRKGARPFSSGGTQVFQLQTEDIGPLKSTLSIATT